jgi:NADPH:quinone reductase-like Zn-dependent oxidoreductase
VDSTGKLDMLRSIGADHVIDYTKEDFTRSGQRYDRILDVAAYHSIFECKRALKPNGVYVVVPNSVAGMFQAVFVGPLISMAGSRKMGIQKGRPFDKADVAFLKELIEAGKVTPAAGEDPQSPGGYLPGDLPGARRPRTAGSGPGHVPCRERGDRELAYARAVWVRS